MGFWSRTHVCCAVPLYNSGIYAILVQFFVIALLCAILSFASPNIVALSVPTFAPYILGVVCLLIAGIQAFGFFGVYRERPSLYKLYHRTNIGLIVIALVISLVFIIVSAVQHNQTTLVCESAFTSQPLSNAGNIAGTNTTINSGSTPNGNAICNIYMWIQVGVMGALLLIVAIAEGYFLLCESIYAKEQLDDHAKYEQVYSSAAEEIRQSGLWESNSVGGRPSDSDEFARSGAGVGGGSVTGIGAGGYTSTSRLAHTRTGSNLRNEYSDKDPDLFPQRHPLEQGEYGQEDPFDPPIGPGGYPAQDNFGGMEYTHQPVGAGPSSHPVDPAYHHPSDPINQSYPARGNYSGAERGQAPVAGWDPKYHEV